MSYEPSRPVPRYDELSYKDCLNHFIPNRPFILSAENTASWPCKSWRIPQHNGQCSAPDFNALRQYGNQVVPVANTLKREFSEFEREDWPLDEVLDLWEKGEGEGLYIKDWHIFEEIEKAGQGGDTIYTVPPCLRDDWLNPPFTPGPPHPSVASASPVGDFRFCYIGPKGTFTPLHRDVYASYSWSANVVGRKLWWFFPPEKLDGVKDKHGELVFDVRALEGEGGGIKVVQEEGEIIFVPSGWHHQVLNLEFCISINHNFFSSPTLLRIFEAMVQAQKRVEESISDILPMIKQRLGEEGAWEEEWVEEVQGLLERDSGWGWKGFWETIKVNIERPPGGECSPDRATRDGFVREVVRLYKDLPEWKILHDVRATILDIERIIASEEVNHVK